MAHSNQSMLGSFKNLNIITGLALAAFLALGFWVTGLAGEAVDLLDANPVAALVASLITLIVLFASSNTRSMERYHPAEMALVFLAIGLMVCLQFLTSFGEFVASAQPITGGVIMLLMLIAGLIVGK